MSFSPIHRIFHEAIKLCVGRYFADLDTQFIKLIKINPTTPITLNITYLSLPSIPAFQMNVAAITVSLGLLFLIKSGI